jgi:hypothetical protein
MDQEEERKSKQHLWSSPFPVHAFGAPKMADQASFPQRQLSQLMPYHELLIVAVDASAIKEKISQVSQVACRREQGMK